MISLGNHPVQQVGGPGCEHEAGTESRGVSC